MAWWWARKSVASAAGMQAKSKCLFSWNVTGVQTWFYFMSERHYLSYFFYKHV